MEISGAMSPADRFARFLVGVCVAFAGLAMLAFAVALFLVITLGIPFGIDLSILLAILGELLALVGIWKITGFLIRCAEQTVIRFVWNGESLEISTEAFRRRYAGGQIRHIRPRTLGGIVSQLETAYDLTFADGWRYRLVPSLPNAAQLVATLRPIARGVRSPPPEDGQ